MNISGVSFGSLDWGVVFGVLRVLKVSERTRLELSAAVSSCFYLIINSEKPPLNTNSPICS